MKLLDVSLTEDLPEKGLRRGQVGTIVDVRAPGVWEVEFANTEGRTYASLAVAESRLMLLHLQAHGTSGLMQFRDPRGTCAHST